MHTIMTELEKDPHERLLHKEMEAYTNCFVVDKVKVLALFDEDIGKLNVKLEKAKQYYQNTVSEIEQIQMEIKEVFDTKMKKQLQKMSGSEDDWTLELRKFPLMQIDSSDYESVTVEQLEAWPRDKLPQLQSYTYFGGSLTKIELSFSNGLDSAAYTTSSYASTYTKHVQNWDTSKKVQKISVKFHTNGSIYGMKFLDENDNELNKCEYGSGNG